MMKNLDLIITTYKEISTEKLILLSKNPSDLQIEVIPHLQAELISRGKLQEVKELDNYLQNGINERIDYRDFSKEEIHALIQERLALGESFESIKIDLKENGINIFDILKEEAKTEARHFDFIANLQNNGAHDAEIADKLNYAFGTSQEEAEELKAKYENRKRIGIIVGAILIAFEIIQFLLQLMD